MQTHTSSSTFDVLFHHLRQEYSLGDQVLLHARRTPSDTVIVTTSPVSVMEYYEVTKNELRHLRDGSCVHRKPLLPRIFLSLWPNQLPLFNGNTHHAALGLHEDWNLGGDDLQRAQKLRQTHYNPDLVAERNVSSRTFMRKCYNRIHRAARVLKDAVRREKYRQQLPHLRKLLAGDNVAWDQVALSGLQRALRHVLTFPSASLNAHERKEYEKALRDNMPTIRLIRKMRKWARSQALHIVGWVELLDAGDSWDSQYLPRVRQDEHRQQQTAPLIPPGFPLESEEEDIQCSESERLALDQRRRDIVKDFTPNVAHHAGYLEHCKNCLRYVSNNLCHRYDIDPQLVVPDEHQHECHYCLAPLCHWQEDVMQRDNAVHFLNQGKQVPLSRQNRVRLFTKKGVWMSQCACCHGGNPVFAVDHLLLSSLAVSIPNASQQRLAKERVMVDQAGQLWKERQFRDVNTARATCRNIVKSALAQAGIFRKAQENSLVWFQGCHPLKKMHIEIFIQTAIQPYLDFFLCHVSVSSLLASDLGWYLMMQPPAQDAQSSFILVKQQQTSYDHPVGTKRSASSLDKLETLPTTCLPGRPLDNRQFFNVPNPFYQCDQNMLLAVKCLPVHLAARGVVPVLFLHDDASPITTRCTHSNTNHAKTNVFINDVSACFQIFDKLESAGTLIYRTR